MKKLMLILTIALCLYAAPALPFDRVTYWECTTDLIDTEGIVDGAIKRESGTTYIHEGILHTADGDDTPINNASLDDEAGATNVRVSVPDGQAWVHDTGGIIAAFAGTGNLVIMYDGAGVGYMYGFLGEVGTGLTTAALTNNVTAITLANPGVVSSIAHGLVIGDLVFFNGLSEMVELNGTYKTVTAIGGVNVFSVNDTSGYGFAEATGGACAWEVTEPGNTGVHVYKERGLINEGWLAWDTGTNLNAGAAWDFNIHDNRLTSTGTGAEAVFEDGWGRFEPEGTNLILYSEDFSQWMTSQITLDTSEADPRGGTGATGLVTSVVAGSHYVYIYPTFADGNVTASIFAKAGAQGWVKLQVNLKDGTTKHCNFQLSGVGATGINTTTKESIERLGTTDWYRIHVTHDVGTGATVPAIVVFSAEGDNDTTFSGDGSTIDTYIYGAQAEQTLFLTSYIPTAGIPVTRTTEAGSAADNGVSWTTPQVLKNILDDAEPVASPTDSQGTLTFQIKWGCDESDIVAGTYGLISVVNSIVSVGYFNDSSYRLWDGTAVTSVNHPAFSAGDEIDYASRWGDVDGETDDISAGLREDDGDWSFDGTPGAYDGEFTLGNKVRLGFGCLYPFHYRHIAFWDGPIWFEHRVFLIN